MIGLSNRNEEGRSVGGKKNGRKGGWYGGQVGWGENKGDLSRNREEIFFRKIRKRRSTITNLGGSQLN